MLKIGSTGIEVDLLKQALKNAGFEVTENDIFDKKTLLAVKAFQTKHVDKYDNPLKVDGIVGSLTQWALKNYLQNQSNNQTQPENEQKTGILAKTALKIAINEMNIGAKEIGKNNSGEFVEKYTKTKDGGGLDWCAGFVSFCFEQAEKETKIKCPIKYTLSARNIFDQAKKKNLTITDRNILPIPGDIVVWYRGTSKSYLGHVGICTSYSNGYIFVIEGNKGSFPAEVKVYKYVWKNMDKLIGLVRMTE